MSRTILLYYLVCSKIPLVFLVLLGIQEPVPKNNILGKGFIVICFNFSLMSCFSFCNACENPSRAFVSCIYSKGHNLSSNDLKCSLNQTRSFSCFEHTHTHTYLSKPFFGRK